MTEILAAALIGLVSASHCLGMCGGLMVAAGLNSASARLSVAYNLGRISTYAILGGIFGLLSSQIPVQTLPVLKLLSGVLLILSALYLLNLSRLLNQFEKIGLPLWRRLQPLSRRLLPIKSVPAAYGLGVLWGFIPCGLVYTALAFSLSAGNGWQSAVLMLSFGIGTLPAMIGISLLAQQVRGFLKRTIVRYSLALTLTVIALFFWYQALSALR